MDLTSRTAKCHIQPAILVGFWTNATGIFAEFGRIALQGSRRGWSRVSGDMGLLLDAAGADAEGAVVVALGGVDADAGGGDLGSGDNVCGTQRTISSEPSS